MEPPVILFEEIQRSQRLKNKWFYGAAAVLFGLVLVWNYFSHKETPVFTHLLWSGFIIFILLHLFLSVSFELVMQIREDGIYVRYPPYQPSFSKYKWENIKEIYIRRFDPFKEYGYGVRLGPNGRGYTLPGTTGIQIVLNDNSTLIISTKRPEEVMKILRKMGRVK
jgi:Family of unknown function (DUF6141)